MTIAQLKEKIQNLPDDYILQEKQCGFISDMRYEFEIMDHRVMIHRFYEHNPPWEYSQENKNRSD